MKTTRSLGKSLFSLGLFAGLCAAPTLAHAHADSYVELQLDARTVSDLARRQLATMSNFCPQAIRLDGVDAYVDHLAFSQDGELARADTPSRVFINDFAEVEGRAVLYIQPVELHVKTAECALDPECETTTAVGAELTYELFTTASQLCMRSYASRGLPEGVTPPEVKVCLPFRADQALLAAGLPDETASGNAVSLDAEGRRVAMRIELGRTARDYEDQDRLRDWQGFVDGEVEETGADGDWSVFIHKSLILGGVERRLSTALHEQAGFNVDGPVSVSWDGGDSDARIEVAFEGVFTQTFCPNDIHVRDITLSGVVGPNDREAPTGLQIEGFVGYDISAADAAECGMALGGPIGALVFSSLSDSIRPDLSSLGPNCRADGDFGFACDEPVLPAHVSIGPMESANTSLGRFAATPTGLAMNGRLETVGNAFLTAGGRTTSFTYDERAEAFVGDLQMGGTARVCDSIFWAEREGDIHLLDIKTPPGYGLPASFGVALRRENVDAYVESPFRLMATVMTSAGVRTYRFDEIDPM